MAKKKKHKIQSSVPAHAEQGSKTKLTNRQQQWLGIGLVVFVLILQFAPMVFDGLSPTGTDVIGGLGKVHQVKEFEKETGERPLWNPYV
ncbi:hypothetical protein HQ585_19750, partial [candidate division KSB1 bacterium]|nr:hypothetical protein [candidate division KSB1 bacterium]